MGMDILGPKQIVIDIPSRRLLFRSCEGIFVSCEVKAYDNVQIRRTVRTTKKKMILLKFTALISMPSKGKGELLERDFLFEPSLLGAYAHFFDARVQFINVRNDRDTPLELGSRRRGRVHSRIRRRGVLCCGDRESFLSNIPLSVEHPILSELDPIGSGIRPSREVIPKVLETQLDNGITVYGCPADVPRLVEVITRHPRIWEDYWRHDRPS